MGNQNSIEGEKILDESKEIGRTSKSESLYIFGLNQRGEKEILVFEPLNESFYFVNPPFDMPIFHYMSAIRISPSRIYIAGGIDKSRNEISPDLIEYDPFTNSFNRLCCMIQPRYTHSLTFFEGFLYAIGGRTYGEGINGLLRTCEKYDFSSCKWKSIASLASPRCTFFTFEYQSSIYICGGFNGNRRRSETIERYDSVLDKWELFDFKLNKGVECGSIHIPPNTKDQFMIFGGNIKDGGSNECWRHNLTTRRSDLVQKMKSKRILSKSILSSLNILYIIGGDIQQDEDGGSLIENQTIEKCTIDNSQVTDFFQFNSLEIFRDRPFSVWKGFSQASDIQIVLSETQPQPLSPKACTLQQNEQGLSSQKVSAKTINKTYSHSFSHSANALFRNLFGSSAKNTEKSQKNYQHFSGSPLVSKRLDMNQLDEFYSQKDNNTSTNITNQPTSIKLHLQKEEVLNKKSPFNLLWYIFGATKDQDFIGEIDLGLVTCTIKKRPRKLILASHRNGVRIEETMSIFICGGVSDDMSKIYPSTFRYFPDTDSVELLSPMVEGRYTFSCIKKGNYIYALGGRTYGNDSHAILSKCERFNIAYGIWEPIASMNYRRCSFMASCIHNIIYVTGGYGGHSLRHGTFECYHEKENRWELMGISLIEPVEASTILNIHTHDSKKILILGGRTAKDDSHNIYSYDITNGFDAFQGKVSGSIGTKRCLHKQIPLNPSNTRFLLLGGFTKGERIEGFEYNPKTNSIIQCNQLYQTLIQKLDEFLFKELQNSDQTLRKNLFL